MNEKLRLYHGSDHEVGAPVFGVGKSINDYGRGFYCTMDEEMAREWACGGKGNGYVNNYQLDISGLNILRLDDTSYSALNWLAVLLDNRVFDLNQPIPRSNRDYILREFLPDYRSADVIIGYRADDSYFSFAKDFLSNAISLADLSRALKLGKLGLQHVLLSKEAFSRIEYLGCTPVDASVYYQKRCERDAAARSEFRKISEQGPADDAILAFDIVRNKMKNNDPRLR